MMPIQFPTDDHEWWWMRCKLKPRGKWRVLLVELVEHDCVQYVRPFGDNNCYTRNIVENALHANFLPAEPPPSEDNWS